jgi:4'-phosphopantetheinyl transferase
MDHCDQIYWLERPAADVPANESWLSTTEVNHLRTLHVPKRRADWLLGRWTTKNAVATYLGLSAEPRGLADIEIRRQVSGAPQAFCQDAPAPVSISLSHRVDLGACAVAPAVLRVGCDLEIAEPHSDAFLTDYFTREEQAMVVSRNPADRVWLLSLFWSAKESALKALGEGLRLDTRHLTVQFPKAALCVNDDDLQNACPCSICGNAFHRNFWSSLQVHKLNAQILDGFWNRTGTLVRTLIAVPA